MIKKSQLPHFESVDSLSTKEAIRSTHPAFGLVTVSRPQASPGVNLFGSDLSHNHFISVTIQTAKNERELGRDWQFPTGTLLEFHMSEAQWARFVSGAGRSQATPVTLSYAPSPGSSYEVVPSIEVPRESRKDQFNAEFKESLRSALEEIRTISENLRKLTEEKSVSKTKLKELSKSLENRVGNLPSNLNFAVTSFKEATEDIVEAAKAEIEAYSTNALLKAGEKALLAESSNVPKLPPM